MKYLTVEEVSARYGVPVSTVRRWCADATLPAEKSGRQWLVREDELPTSPPRVRTRRPTTAQSSSYDVGRALLHVTNTDLRETWVPDVLDFQDAPLDDSLLSRVSQRLNDSLVSPPTEVPIPKTPFFTRSAVLLTLEDRIAYQAVVGSLPQERKRRPTRAFTRPAWQRSRESTSSARKGLTRGLPSGRQCSASSRQDQSGL